MSDHTLRWSRIMLSVCGCLPPAWWSPSAKYCYRFYTLFVWLLLHTLTCAQILDIIINVENMQQFSENFYVTPMLFVACCKMTIILKHRRIISTLIGDLEEAPFSATNGEEDKIRAKCNKTNERVAICYTILVVVSACCIFVRGYLSNYKTRELSLRVWLPYDYTELLPYTLSYIYEATTGTLTSCLSSAFDTLFAGLLFQIYGQLEILEERLRSIQGNESDSVKQCAIHYHRIYKFGRSVNETFKVILFMQFCALSFVLCFNLYRMSNITALSKFFEASLYITRILAQILYYCWFSNEVKLKSLEIPDMIFKSNWITWDEKAKKLLLIIMRRATQPIEFTSGYLIILNLDLFVALLKTGYSVFNLLQRSK